MRHPLWRKTTLPEVATKLMEERGRVNVADLMAQVKVGRTNAQIGEVLFISEKTVRNHITRIFDKLGVHSRARAIVLAKDGHLQGG